MLVFLLVLGGVGSLSSWRAWIEIPSKAEPATGRNSRSPHGERGLKYEKATEDTARAGRSPHGERGLKLKNNGEYDVMTGRSPHGERGLKYTLVHTVQTPDMSLSSWRAWIEISNNTSIST